MELDPQNHNGDGFLGPDSIRVVYMDPLGCGFSRLSLRWASRIPNPQGLGFRVQETISTSEKGTSMHTYAAKAEISTSLVLRPADTVGRSRATTT